MNEIPIVFLDRSGHPTDDRISGAPCVRVGLRDYGSGNLPAGPFSVAEHWALIDTGADHVYADPTVLAEAGAAVWGSAHINQEGTTSPLHRCYVIFSQLTPRVAVQAVVMVRQFAAMQDPYRLALGRAALQSFTLTFNANDRPSKLVQID